MTPRFTIAIVGRPNVGKSALFNRICRGRIAIVDEAEGVTRDRLYGEADAFGTDLRLVDTGGIDPRATTPFNEQVREQSQLAIAEADAVVLVVDGRVGITTLDAEVAQIVRKQDKPVIVAVNKLDNREQQELLYPFYSLGIEQIIGVSAQHGLNIAELLEALREITQTIESPVEEPDPGMKIALVGRANTGKSSLINTLLDESRCIVSPVAGTTRDSIDVKVEDAEGNAFTLIDTAGIRRKTAEHEVVDKFAAIRTERAIERCDVCLLMLDAQVGMTTQDKRIARAIEKAGKGCVLLFNKWDLVKGVRMEHCFQVLDDEVPFLRHCPHLAISAVTSRNVDKILAMAKMVYEENRKRIPTGELNRVVSDAMQLNHPPMIRGKRLRVYYLAQVEVAPPTFTLFINHIDRLDETYKRYLINQLRKHHPFTGAPIVMYAKGKPPRKKGGQAPKRSAEREEAIY